MSPWAENIVEKLSRHTPVKPLSLWTLPSLEITPKTGKKFTVALHTSCLDTAFYFKWPQIQERVDVKKLDPLTRIHRDISAGSFVLPTRCIQLRRGVARVLTFANTASEINKEPGWDITAWARR